MKIDFDNDGYFVDKQTVKDVLSAMTSLRESVPFGSVAVYFSDDEYLAFECAYLDAYEGVKGVNKGEGIDVGDNIFICNEKAYDD